MHLVFVEKAEIVHFAIFPLYKRQKVWYNKSVVAKQGGGATFFVFFKKHKKIEKNAQKSWFLNRDVI